MLIIIFLQQILIFGLNYEFSLFPTEGEFIQYELTYLYDYYGPSCKVNTSVPYVELINKCQEIYRTKGRCKYYGSILEFLSITSNNTHFFALSYENEVFIYEWKNQIMNQVQQPVPIDPSFQCLNINLYLGFEILLDCYKNNQLFLFQIIDALPNIVYQSQSFVPISTKIKSIVNGTNTFLIYAQYFQNYSILSLISAQFQNLSCYSNHFNDFDTPIQINPYIYVITSKEILQFFISSDFKFQLTFNFTTDYQIKFSQILVYYNSKEYSQCDQILVSYSYRSYFYIDQYFGCENYIIDSEEGFIHGFYKFNLIQKILSNNEFIIYQFSIDLIKLSSINHFDFKHYLEINSKSQLYINANTVKNGNFLQRNQNSNHIKSLGNLIVNINLYEKKYICNFDKLNQQIFEVIRSNHFI